MRRHNLERRVAHAHNTGIAIAKVRHTSYCHRDTKFHEDLLAKGNSGVLSLPHSLPIEGGVQLIHNNQVLGAIGVSGVASYEDGKIAQAGASFLSNTI